MELEDLKMLAAASLLGRSIRTYSNDGGRTWSTETPSDGEIHAAVVAAGKIWKEVLRQK